MSLITKKLKSRTSKSIIAVLIAVNMLPLSACGEPLREYASEYIPISKHDELRLVLDESSARPPLYEFCEEIVKVKWSASDKKMLWDILANLEPSVRPSLRASGAMISTLTAKGERQEITVLFVGVYAYVTIGDGEETCYKEKARIGTAYDGTLYDLFFPDFRQAHPIPSNAPSFKPTISLPLDFD